MRINQVQGITPRENLKRTTSNNNNQIHSNKASHTNMMSMPSYSYGRDLVNKKVPTFRGSEINKAAKMLVQQIPVEDRLASLFQVLQQGDMILLGNELNKTLLALKRNVGKLKDPIKKEIFLPDKNIKSHFGFFKNQLGDIEVLNLNDKNTNFITGGKTYSLEPGTSFYIQARDTIQYGDDVLHLKTEPKTDLSFSRHIFSQVFDYKEDIQKEIAKLNQRTVGKQIQELRKAPEVISFANIGGQDKAIEQLKKGILYPIKYASAYAGDDVTRGFILHGPAGTGKTALCRALATEADVNYRYISGTSFQNKYVGESEANVRAFFEDLKANQPSIGVIDEIDAVGAERSDKDVYGAKLVDQILTCITDLYDNHDDVFILGLTNKYEALDKALKRSERLSTHILVDAPDRAGTEDILRKLTKNKPLADDVNYRDLSDKLYEIKAVGSDIKSITRNARECMMNRLGIYEKMENGTFKDSDIEDVKITQEDFLNAIQEFKDQHKKVTMKPIGFNK